ncbi:MAG: hypothetical protein HY291_07935 [Planctomycetes bacterium]|nr:hypothetical protein [Planctomycetota bacterium]
MDMKPLQIPATLVVLAVFSAAAGETWVGVRIATRDGSRLACLVNDHGGLAVKRAEGAAAKVAWTEIKSLRLSARIDPKLDAEARAAVKDLLSDKYETRNRALERLRALGLAAAAALREAQNSADAEVAAQAHALLGDMAAKGGGEAGDELLKADGTKETVTLAEDSFDARTRWGYLRLPLAALESLELLSEAEEAALKKDLGASKPDEIPAEASAPLPDPAGSAAKRYGPEDENVDAIIQGRDPGANFLAGMRVAGFDRGASKDVQPKAGDSVEDLYAAWGALIRGDGGNGKAVADDLEQIMGLTHGMSAACEVDQVRGKGNLEVHFILPGAFDPKTRTGRPGGVHTAGCMIGKATEGKIGFEAYDARGRLLARIFNRQDANAAAANGMPNEFLGVRSPVPIARLRIYRVDPKGPELLRIDDLAFDRVGPADRDERYSAAETLAGDRIIGHSVPVPGGEKDRIALKPVFLPATLPAWEIKLAGLARFEPAKPDLLGDALTKPKHEEDAPKRVRIGGPLHAILLQNGESFRAHFIKLDKELVTFDLAGGVELKLPRGLLRKVDLYPDQAAPGETAEALKVADGEKPGVEFKQKIIGDNPAAPQKEPEKKDPNNNPAQGLPRMDNAEVLAANLETNELVVDPKDGGGAWPIDLKTARLLVFPPDPKAGGGGPHDWVLTLRQGSRFEVDLKSIGEVEIVAEFAGGSVTLPAALVEAIARRPRKE